MKDFEITGAMIDGEYVDAETPIIFSADWPERSIHEILKTDGARLWEDLYWEKPDEVFGGPK